MGEASLTICMTKAWLSFASLFLESIVTSAAGEISDSFVGINYPAERESYPSYASVYFYSHLCVLKG